MTRGGGATVPTGRLRALAVGLVAAGVLAAAPAPAPALAAVAVPGAVPVTVPPARTAVAAADRQVMVVGDQLLPGDRLVSASGLTRLELGTDGRLVMIRSHWLSPAPLVLAEGVARVVLQGDGNLVALGGGGYPLWASGTDGSGAASLRLVDGGSLVFAAPGGRTVGEGLDVGTDGDGWSGGVLRAGGVMLAGDRLFFGSHLPDRPRDGLVLQGDGNLVRYGSRSPAGVWSSGTAGNPGAGLVMQADGNLVLYSASRRALWSSESAGRAAPGAAVLAHLDGGKELRVLSSSDATRATSLWAPEWGSPWLYRDTAMFVGDQRRSAGGTCRLVVQQDLNVVQYCRGAAVFATGTPPAAPGSSARFVMQTDGNAVAVQERVPALSGGSRAYFSTGTSGVGPADLVVQDDTNLVLVRADGRPAWSRLTGRLP